METSDRGRDGLDLHERDFRLANLVWQVVMVAVHCVQGGPLYLSRVVTAISHDNVTSASVGGFCLFSCLAFFSDTKSLCYY